MKRSGRGHGKAQDDEGGAVGDLVAGVRQRWRESPCWGALGSEARAGHRLAACRPAATGEAHSFAAGTLFKGGKMDFFKQPQSLYCCTKGLIDDGERSAWRGQSGVCSTSSLAINHLPEGHKQCPLPSPSHSMAPRLLTDTPGARSTAWAHWGALPASQGLGSEKGARQGRSWAGGAGSDQSIQGGGGQVTEP